MSEHKHRVVVTGLGVVAPNGHGLEAFEQALRVGKSGITFHQRLADLKFGCQVGGVPELSQETIQSYFTAEQLLAIEIFPASVFFYHGGKHVFDAFVGRKAARAHFALAPATCHIARHTGP